MNVLPSFNKIDATKPSAILATVIFLIIALSHSIPPNPVYSETGKGTDIFRVIMTVFGVENTKGDIVAIVSVNNGEASRVKFLETEAFKPVTSNLTSLPVTPSPNSNVGIMEYVATFPNITVNSGAEYKACVMTTKGLELLC
jgi:hypothetical protein